MLSGISLLMGWFKLNAEGSFVGNQGLASSGGIICDNNGNCVQGFSRSIGRATSMLT